MILSPVKFSNRLQKKRNVIYSNPVYAEGFYYFLQGDYDEKKISLYRYIPGKLLEKETELSSASRWRKKKGDEGWNDKNDCATDNYDLYYKVIVKDFSGNTLSEEVGDLYQAADGTWWIA